MAISSAGNLSRVSTSLRTFTLITQIQRNSLRIFQEEQRISSGNRLLSVGEDPIAAEKITRMLKSLDGQEQILTNLRHADNQLAAADTAVAEISDILIEAARIASEQAGNLQSTEERASQAIVIDGLIDQLMNIANRQFQGRFLFGGRRIEAQPIDTSFGRVTIPADQAFRETIVGVNFTKSFNVTTAGLFGLREEVVGGYAGFNVQLNLAARISELDGANGNGISLGAISVTETGPNVTFQVDFTGAETVGDMIARFDDAAATAGSALTLRINPADGAALQIVPGPFSGIQVQEVGQGTTAADLGIKKTTIAGMALDGDNLNRRATLTTLLSDLIPGGLTLPDGVVITNGTEMATVTFGGATTVQDVLNRLNGAGVGIRAAINQAGDGIEVEDLIAGTPLVIGENGGNDAEALGIRTLDPSVLVSRLNGGFGIHTVDGNDIRITNAILVSFEVDLDGVNTIQDLLDVINAASAAAGAGVTAEISPSGGGLRLIGPAGPNPLTVEAINLSQAAEDLGLLTTGTATVLDGQIVGEFVQTGVFSALYRLRDGLLSDDSVEITEAGGRINALQLLVNKASGQVGARSRDMQNRLFQTESAVEATSVLLSELRDVDFIEAVTKFQQAQTALQASLQSGALGFNLSLLDFLR